MILYIYILCAILNIIKTVFLSYIFPILGNQGVTHSVPTAFMMNAVGTVWVTLGLPRMIFPNQNLINMLKVNTAFVMLITTSELYQCGNGKQIYIIVQQQTMCTLWIFKRMSLFIFLKKDKLIILHV